MGKVVVVGLDGVPFGMLKGFADVWSTSTKEKVTLRDAAFMLAITKIAKAVELRGIFP